jgi:hypothetical protein
MKKNPRNRLMLRRINLKILQQYSHNGNYLKGNYRVSVIQLFKLKFNLFWKRTMICKSLKANIVILT